MPARIVVTEFVSLDGVMEAPGGEPDFKYPGWTFEIERGDDGNQFKMDELMESEVQLLGRVTYEGFAEAWPSREGPFADKLNNDPKYVVSTTLTEPTWQNTTVIADDVAGQIAALKERTNGTILVAGSGTLVATLLEHDLVDELRLKVYPVVLGAGKRLFGELTDKKLVRLVDMKTVGNGVAILTYEPVRATDGSLALDVSLSQTGDVPPTNDQETRTR
jgi:dihydrofolate reductase